MLRKQGEHKLTEFQYINTLRIIFIRNAALYYVYWTICIGRQWYL